VTLELPTARLPSLTEMKAAADRHAWTNAFVCTIFAVTGPVAIILTVASAGGLSKAVIDNWIFGAFFVGGALTVLCSLFYRQPLALAWTMPGSALLITALDHLSFAEAVGAFLVTGVAMVLLGVSGLVAKLMDRIPVGVAMGMVAGVFLSFGIDLVTGFRDSPFLSIAMVGAFVVFTAIPTLRRVVPPLLAALLAGAVAAGFLGQVPTFPVGADWVIRPSIVVPVFSVPAMLELVVPLMISVLAVQNLQGFTVLREAGHPAPTSALTVACGYGSLAMGILGSVPTCVTGPANAFLVSSGKREYQYMGGILFGLMFAAVGIVAPLLTQVATTMPRVFITALGGLAMLPVLINAFRAAFGASAAPGALGQLVSFVVTLSGITLFNIGAPFWGIVFGFAVHVGLDRRG
jgi:benzoate membrane transport protein